MPEAKLSGAWIVSRVWIDLDDSEQDWSDDQIRARAKDLYGIAGEIEFDEAAPVQRV